MTIVNTTETHRIFPCIDRHHKDKLETYLNIRVASRTNRNDTKDIGLWYENGVSLKVKLASFLTGKILKGYYSEEEPTNLNDRIFKVWHIMIESYKQLSI